MCLSPLWTDLCLQYDRFLTGMKKTKSFAFLPKENQNFRLVQTPNSQPPCMAYVFQPLLLVGL